MNQGESRVVIVGGVLELVVLSGLVIPLFDGLLDLIGDIHGEIDALSAVGILKAGDSCSSETCATAVQTALLSSNWYATWSRTSARSSSWATTIYSSATGNTEIAGFSSLVILSNAASSSTANQRQLN
jgi:hypothetical protein